MLPIHVILSITLYSIHKFFAKFIFTILSLTEPKPQCHFIYKNYKLFYISFTIVHTRTENRQAICTRKIKTEAHEQALHFPHQKWRTADHFPSHRSWISLIRSLNSMWERLMLALSVASWLRTSPIQGLNCDPCNIEGKMEGGKGTPEAKWEEKAGAEPPWLTRSKACDVWANLETNGVSPEVPANECFRPVPTISTSSSIRTLRSMSEDPAPCWVMLESGTGTSESCDGGLDRGRNRRDGDGQNSGRTGRGEWRNLTDRTRRNTRRCLGSWRRGRSGNLVFAASAGLLVDKVALALTGVVDAEIGEANDAAFNTALALQKLRGRNRQEVNYSPGLATCCALWCQRPCPLYGFDAWCCSLNYPSSSPCHS